MTDRIDVIILGRKLGTASGWDGEPGICEWFYDFEPCNEIDLPKCDLVFDITNGYIRAQNPDDGEIRNKQDVISLLLQIARIEN